MAHTENALVRVSHDLPTQAAHFGEPTQTSNQPRRDEVLVLSVAKSSFRVLIVR